MITRWFYWNFKMESKTYEEWSYLSGLDYGEFEILRISLKPMH